MSKLGKQTYLEKVYACWLGKNIGGTLGGPHEGKPGPLNLTFYDPVPTEPAPNDDLDLQLIWLHALETHGLRLTPAQLSQEWLHHNTYPWCEYGFSQLNARRGLQPPVTGSYDNWFGDCMGAPIRSEIWACIAPGAPHLACEYAWRDAVRDHWGEGVWGELFFAAVESAAFVVNDRDALLDIGLATVPPWSATARAIEIVRASHAQGLDWLEVRERILAAVGQQHPTHAPMNVAFVVLGWLYGHDFGDALLKAVNCGQDTDCTGATLGAILGIVGGPSAIPEVWREPVGDAIRPGWGVVNLEVPANLGELTSRVCAIGEELAGHFPDAPRFVDGDEASAEPREMYRLAAQAMHLWGRRPDEVWLTDDASVRFRYLGPPVTTPGRPKRGIVVGAGGVGVKPPPGWKVDVRQVDGIYEVTVVPDETMPAYAAMELTVGGRAQSIAFVRRPRWQAARLPLQEPGEEPPAPGKWLLWEPDGHEMDLTALLQGCEGMAALRTFAVTPRDTRAVLHVVTPHRARAWLKGRLVVTKNSTQNNDRPPYLEAEDSHAEVNLETGRNELYVAVLSSGGPCLLRVYLTDQEGHGLAEVYYDI
ncbi:MAG: ADP-ribosylglycohydrolase family protein [Armatimonadetes bacterium]|nr:ADP-ribosylglycohydrolase family protein [Armatimonadota bacterium]